jgi:hypothetical protein
MAKLHKRRRRGAVVGVPQQKFLSRMQAALADGFPAATEWTGGQIIANCAAIKPDESLRRGGYVRRGERFELGDLRCLIGTTAIIVEYESGAIALHNLVKYWPYLRGVLSSRPQFDVVLCHFSSWSSYGSYRDLWNWQARQMSDDGALLVKFTARQFDHGDADLAAADKSISKCLEWIKVEALGTTPA